MSSKHSILLGTDGPDGDSTTGKFITPSAHVLAATEHSTPVGQSSAAIGTTGDKYITASPAVAVASSGFGDADGEAQQLLPSSRDSVAARLPFDSSAPRTLSSTPPSSADRDTATPAAPAPATGFINPALAESMSTLSATFASMIAEAAKAEQEEKVESTIQSLQTGSNDAVAAAAAPSKLSTCFDLITSTATRIPLSTIIAASASHPSNSGGGPASVSSLALESYVVVEPIDWSRHHHDSTFARLTGVNRGADQVDEIALELAAERNALQRQLDDKDRIIQEQRAQIQALQRQLHDATRNNSGAASASPAAAAAAATAVASTSPARASAAASGPSASLPSDADDDSGDDLDIDEGMCDEEDSGHGAAAAANGADKKASSSTTFAI